jgi:hypothetical protein
MTKQFDTSFSGKLKQFSGKTGRCFETHPALKVGDHEVFGGSCIDPIIKDADIYIGFDGGMRMTGASYPWNASRVEVLFYIADGTAPAQADEFKKMVIWAAEQIKAGKKLHAGCIGGHGRTGTFLAALVTHMTGIKDSITYVRENYCQKAVESSSQVDFLHKHYGIKKVSGSKAHLYGGHSKSSSWSPTYSPSPSPDKKPSNGYQGSSGGVKPSPPTKPTEYSASSKQIHPVESSKNIWASV